MYFDPKTKLFRDISDQKRQELRDWAKSVILEGTLPTPEPPWVTQLLEAINVPGQRLLVLSTVVPQRILLSIVEEDERLLALRAQRS